MPTATPRSIIVTRLAAGLQVVLLLAFITVDLTAAALMGRSSTDHAEEQRNAEDQDATDPSALQSPIS